MIFNCFQYNNIVKCRCKIRVFSAGWYTGKMQNRCNTHTSEYCLTYCNIPLQDHFPDFFFLFCTIDIRSDLKHITENIICQCVFITVVCVKEILLISARLHNSVIESAQNEISPIISTGKGCLQIFLLWF